MNLCRPDTRKSCAACCGIYNTHNSEKLHLERLILRRTEMFEQVRRQTADLLNFKEHIRITENVRTLDDDIHFCEFSGFLDSDRKIVGCMLHPTTPGNDGIDFRGLCHYGSMACKLFYCPAWTDLSPERRDFVIDLVDDWCAYGLIINDVDYVDCVMDLLQITMGTGCIADFRDRERDAARKLLLLKSQLDSQSAVQIRNSRYYFKPQHPKPSTNLLAEMLEYNYGRKLPEISITIETIMQSL